MASTELTEQIIRAIAFHDIPLKCPLWTLLSSGKQNVTYFKGLVYFRYPDWGYPASGQWLPSNWRVRSRSISFEKYGYSPINLIGTRSLSVTLVVNKYDFRNSKGTNRLLWKSSDRICHLNQKVIMASWFYFHYRNLTVQTWIVNIIYDFGSNRFRRYGKCCPLWTTLQHPAMVVTPWHNDCCLYYKYTVFRHSHVEQWFPVGSGVYL